MNNSEDKYILSSEDLNHLTQLINDDFGEVLAEAIQKYLEMYKVKSTKEGENYASLYSRDSIRSKSNRT